MAPTPRSCSRERGCGGAGWWGWQAGWQAAAAIWAWGLLAVPGTLPCLCPCRPFATSLRSRSPPGQHRAPWPQCPRGACAVGGTAQRCPSPFAGELLPSLPPARMSWVQPELGEQREEEEGEPWVL